MNIILALLVLAASGARAAGEPRPLLFVPDPAALDWAALRALTGEARSRFSLALAPAATPEAERAWLREAAQSGRIELCLRLAGDPFLPVMAPARPSALPERLAVEKALFRAAFGTDPAGFVAAGAAPGPQALALLSANGFAWTAAGAGAYSRPWAAASTLRAVPFIAAKSPDAAGDPEPGISRGVVVDETVTLAPGAGLPLLKSLLERTSWGTAAQAALEEGAFGVAPASWPSWEDAGGWAAAEEGLPARRIYLLASEAVERYQNSGTASIKNLEKAAAALDAGAAIRRFRPGADPEPLIAALSPAFKAAGAAVPEADGGPGEGAVTATPLARGVSFTGAASVSTAPWLPQSLKVERIGSESVFTIALKGLEADPGAALGFAGVSVELYIDVNGLAGRGSTRLLGGRRHLIAAKDAWEFAVVIEPSGAALWRVGLPSPSRLTSLAAESDPEKGEFRVRVPAGRLRGQPSSWGYLLLSTPAGAQEPQGLLGRASDQKLLMGEGTPPVLRALRLIER